MLILEIRTGLSELKPNVKNSRWLYRTPTLEKDLRDKNIRQTEAVSPSKYKRRVYIHTRLL